MRASPEPVYICSPSAVASICLAAAAAAVMALLLGYGLVTFPEMLLQAPAAAAAQSSRHFTPSSL